MLDGWQGDPVEFGRRLHWEALRGGLGRARARLVVGAGAAWIWNVAGPLEKGSTELLDFYHASEHLWGFGRALNGEDEAATAQWVEPLAPPTAAWGREENARPDRRFKSSQRRSGQGSAARTELFRVPRWKDELPDPSPARLAHRFRGCQVGLPTASMPILTPQTILDARRHAPPERTHRSQTQQLLE